MRQSATASAWPKRASSLRSAAGGQWWRSSGARLVWRGSMKGTTARPGQRFPCRGTFRNEDAEWICRIWR